ncbi:MAG: substrate-binding domain-containing protein [Lachnospiraceae bacterium]|nr:substrate-binding domain-containing protein [Lachnospiraceae bacterium]
MKTILLLTAVLTVFVFTGCSAGSGTDGNVTGSPSQGGTDREQDSGFSETVDNDVREAVNFNRELDSYVPARDHYNFYFTYKTVHSWWDAIALGMEEAQRQFLAKGVTITYEYMAPLAASAADQTERLLQAAKGDYDVIGVDVADEDIISPLLDELVDEGNRIMTFSSSDASEECKRIAYVGNTHNYEDGRDLAEALCERLGYKGRVAILVGSFGATCHEDRARGAKDVISKYTDMEIVATEYDMDSVSMAYELTKKILNEYPDIDGIVCGNMSNPVGAARAVTEQNSKAVIVGMDHDREALHYLRDGVIYCLGVQDCYSIVFDTIMVAVKIADGLQPGNEYPEKYPEKTTIIYRDDASLMLKLLYGDIS